MVDLTQQEIETMNAEVESLTDTPDSTGLDPSIAQKVAVDVINKKFWDESNNRILNYEIEKKNLNGTYPDNQITEQDIIDCSNFSGRIYDATAGDIYRHDCFNGLPELHYDDCEIDLKDNIYVIFDELVNGFTAPANGLTTNSWSGGSGTSDTDLPNGRYLVGNSIVDVTDSVFNTTDYDITYNEIVNATINSGDTIGGFSGFNNTDRQNKTSSLQEVMDYYLFDLDAQLTKTVTALTAMINAVTNNDDPNLSPTALTAHSDHRAFINVYKTTLLITDIGISNFKLTEDTRITNIPIRVGEIDTQLSTLRDQRYNWSSARANSSEGSLTMQKRLQFSKTAIDQKAQAMIAQKNFYETNMGL